MIPFLGAEHMKTHREQGRLKPGADLKETVILEIPAD
jgi:hypothetical protein